ncbi:DUF402 domain-containing protein [Actinosynnema sp. NPDC023658]|uniref:DUF402 domain-containing protein n=1 Tax=Actinosynnema sp. NPDC023658 TaxID=3155465 RepID=UPI0033F8AC6C
MDALPNAKPGTTAVRRDVFRGEVWTAYAVRVVRDDSEALVVACHPGSDVLAPTTWIEWLLTGRVDVRERALPNLAAGRWQLGPWTWRDTTCLQWTPPGAWFSVNAFREPSGDRRLLHWYVNFQRPSRRTALGFDTFDLFLDLVIQPDLSSWSWKDEHEYDQARRLGVVGDADHRAVQRAREQVVAMVEDGGGPFTEWGGWRWDPSWPPPVLPDGVLTDGLTA